MCYGTLKYKALENFDKAYTERQDKDVKLLKKIIKKHGIKQALNKINNSKYCDFMI